MVRENYIKFGGVKFHNNVPQAHINTFVDSLPEEKRKSLYDVVKLLSEQNLITLEHDFRTVDDYFQSLMEKEVRKS